MTKWEEALWSRKSQAIMIRINREASKKMSTIFLIFLIIFQFSSISLYFSSVLGLRVVHSAGERKAYTLGPEYGNVPVLVNTARNVPALLEHLWCTSIARKFWHRPIGLSYVLQKVLIVLSRSLQWNAKTIQYCPIMTNQYLGLKLSTLCPSRHFCPRYLNASVRKYLNMPVFQYC